MNAAVGLLMLLLVLAAFVVAGVLYDQQCTCCYPSISSIKTAAYAHAIKRYRKKFGGFPASLNDLVIRPRHISEERWQRSFLEKVENDPWGNPYSFEVLASGTVIVRCNGADGLPNTADDEVASAK